MLPLGSIPCCMYSWHLWTQCYNQLYLLWWEPNAKWYRGLTLCLVWSLVTLDELKQWILKLVFAFCLHYQSFSFLMFVFYVLQPPSPQHERYHWELSAKFIGKFEEVFSFRRIQKRITRPTLFRELIPRQHWETKFTAHSSLFLPSARVCARVFVACVPVLKPIWEP